MFLIVWHGTYMNYLSAIISEQRVRAGFENVPSFPETNEWKGKPLLRQPRTFYVPSKAEAWAYGAWSPIKAYPGGGYLFWRPYLKSYVCREREIKPGRNVPQVPIATACGLPSTPAEAADSQVNRQNDIQK